MPIQSIIKFQKTQKTRKKRWTDTKKLPTKLLPLNIRRKIKRTIINAPTTKIVPYAEPKLKTIVRDEKYNGGYVIGGPFFVRGTVAEFASTQPQELLYVADDGSIQGFPAPELSESTFSLTHHNSQLEWNNQDSLPRSKNDFPDVSFVSNYEHPTLFLETDSTQCVFGIEPHTLSFWNQLTMNDDESQYNLINGTYLEIKQTGLYLINIYLITREQTSTIGKRGVLLNVSYDLPNKNKESEEDEDFINSETQLILNEQQPNSDIDSDNIHNILRLVNLQQNDIISLRYQIVDGTDEDQTCVLPNSVWSIKFVESQSEFIQGDEEEEETCSFSSSMSSISNENDIIESSPSEEILISEGITEISDDGNQ